MRRLILSLTLLLFATPAFATWTAVGTIMNANNGTAGSTWAPVTSAALESGNIGVCILAKDETGTGTTTPTEQVTSLVDAAGNTWTQGADWCNMRTSTAADGACTAIFWTRAMNTLASGAAMTWTFAASTTRKAATCMEYTASANAIVVQAAGGNGAATTAADPGSLTDATTVNRAHLFIRSSSCESNVTTYTADTDYVAFTGQGTDSTSNSGTAATSITARGEHRIATESTSAASDPTVTAADCASYILALNEDADSCTGACIDVGFPVTTFKSNTTGATITSPSFTVGGDTRTLVLAYTDYTASNDPWPISCAWSGGTPGPATAWVLRVWNACDAGTCDNPNPTYSFTGDSTSGNDQEDTTNRHHTARIWTSTWSGTPAAASVVCTRTGTDANTGIVSVYSIRGAQTTFGTLGQHHSSGTEITNTTAQTMELPITASATGSLIIGSLYWGNATGAVTANGSTTISYQNNDGGSQGVSVAFRLTGTTTASTEYTLGITASQWAWGVSAIEVLVSGSPPTCAQSIALLGMGCR